VFFLLNVHGFHMYLILCNMQGEKISFRKVLGIFRADCVFLLFSVVSFPSFPRSFSFRFSIPDFLFYFFFFFFFNFFLHRRRTLKPVRQRLPLSVPWKGTTSSPLFVPAEDDEEGNSFSFFIRFILSHTHSHIHTYITQFYL